MNKKATAKRHLLSAILLIGTFLVHNQATAQFKNFGLGGGKLNTTAASTNVDYGAPQEYVLGGVTVEGAEYLDQNSLIAIAGLEVGQKIVIPSDDITMALKRLWKQGILGDVKIGIKSIDGNKVYLVIHLTERPRLSKYNFVDVKKSQAEDLTERINLVRGRIVTDALLKNAENNMLSYYQEKGYYNAKVNIIKKKDTLRTNSVALKIKIDKGKKVKIKRISFNGVEELSTKKLKKKMKKTKEKSFVKIFSASKFIKNEYDNDKQGLIDYYNTKGFRNAEIISDSVYFIGPNLVNIDIKIDEDKKFFYRNIDWKGNYIYTDKGLSIVLGIEKGDVYNPAEMAKRLNFNPNDTDVTSLYMDDGYLFFRVEPVEVNIDGDSIDVEMRVYEGEQATISKIIVNGNTKTNDHVIHREIRTIPGQKFSSSDLIRTQRELATLGYFDPEKIGINPVPNFADGTVDIVYDLEEKASDQVELSGGWGGFFGFVGTVGLRFNNFSIRNIGNLKKWKPLPSGDGQKLSLRLQANGRQYQTYSVSFMEPWLGGRQPNSFSVSFMHAVQRTFISNVENGSLRIYNFSVGLGKRLKWPDDYFTLRHTVSYMTYHLNNFNTTGFGSFNTGISFNLNYNLTVSRNSIDNPTYPRSGSALTLSATFTPPYSMFDGRNNYEGLSDQDLFRNVEFNKWMFDNSWFLKIAGNLVLNARMHFGFILPYTPNKELGPFERFILGGDGMVQNSFLLGTDMVGLRGYQNNSIIPYGLNGVGGQVFNKYVLELRYPLSLNPSATIFLLTFAEAGNNWASPKLFNPYDVNRSVGAGARIFMPAFGMIGVDYGYGYDNILGNPGANGGQFHFIIGMPVR